MALWPALDITSAAWRIVSGELTALVGTVIISQRFPPLRWQFGRALILASILPLYLVSLETEFIFVGPIQTLSYVLVYCAIGWYALIGSRLFKKKPAR